MTKLIVHLVHGTQFYCWRKPSIPWVEEDKSGGGDVTGHFRDGVRQRLAHRKIESVDFDIVPWSGRNRHSARLEAARELWRHVEAGPEGAQHFVVAHSHGGNAGLLALREADSHSRRICGIACLSTPFLVVKEAKWARDATIAWAAGGCFVVSLAAFSRFESAGPAIGAVCVAFWPIALLVYFVLKRFKDPSRWVQAPETTDVPLLVVRCPGDEASGWLGTAVMLARVLYFFERLGAWPVRMIQGKRAGLIVCLLTGIALAVGAVVFKPLGSWLIAYGPWALAILLAPWLLGLPARLVIYGMAYGFDLFGLPMRYSVSAESTPLGLWETRLVAPSDQEKWVATHSEPYKLRSVQTQVADWIADHAKPSLPSQPTFARACTNE